MRKLTVDDIVDLRAYERERAEFRRHIIELKQRRRVQLGDLLTLTFENTETMRFQVQEMARAERILSDERIAEEVATYNELIPDPGDLSGTLFLELRDDEQLRRWLPKLVGVQRSVTIWLADGTVVPAVPSDEDRLTREETTAAVHYLTFHLDAGQRARFAQPGTRIVVDHPSYQAMVELTDEQRAELAGDLAV